MQYYVSASAFRSGCGTKESPFKTISEAARLAKVDDERRKRKELLESLLEEETDETKE